MTRQISDYIKNPGLLDSASLSELRQTVARYPYFEAARLLYLRALYKLHDSSFDKELRKASLFLPDRTVLFRMLEADNYRPAPVRKQQHAVVSENTDRTGALIENFLSGIPSDDASRTKRRVRVADASTDYMAYLMQTSGDGEGYDTNGAPPLQHQNLIDEFIGQGDRRIVLSQAPDENLQTPVVADTENAEGEDYFTETLAKIYIKQGKYSKAMEIIRRLSLKYPKKNRYFADQIRFLEKLIINNKNKKP